MANLALNYLRRKLTVPSNFTSEDWLHLQPQMREYVFAMSEVADIEILNRFRSGIESIVLGEKSESETMAGLHDFLKAHKYQPQPGQEGTLNDLRTIDRMRLVLRTNVEDARSHGQWARQQFALSAFPAWRYHQIGRAHV